ncbi:MAG: hypothetical protein H7Z72_09265 [Bacteroidetes bacterium]|nr:hypothetical protein [Fibrella sp.]
MRWLLLRFVLPLLIALPVGYGLLYPQILRCQLVSRSADFVAVDTPGSQVYISRVTLIPQGKQFLDNLTQARHRIKQFWGKSQGRAVLIYCPIQSQYEEYCAGGEGAGCSLGTPWGDSFLVLGPEGNSTDVIAHELCHDELYARLGWLRVKRAIPQWFNEGLAMMLDYRFSAPVTTATGETAAQRHEAYRAEWLYRTGTPERGTPDAKTPGTKIPDPETIDLDTLDLDALDRQSWSGRRLAPLKLDKLETTRDFFGGDYAHVMLAYTTAGLEVSRWLARAGQPAVQKLASAVADGEDFDAVYHRLEGKPGPGSKQLPTN